MAERRAGDRETNEERQRGDDERRFDDQSGRSEASLGQPSFLVHKRHQPDGEIWPAISLHWLGAMKELHPAHAWPPFGVGWYCTVFCDTFAAAVAPLSESAASGTEPIREIRTLRRSSFFSPNVARMSLLLLPALPRRGGKTRNADDVYLKRLR